jgi:hypothetical protein
LRVELRQLLFGLARDPLAPLPDFVCEPLTVLGNVLKNDLVEQNGNWIQITGKGVGTHPERFEWNGTAASERVHDERTSAGRAAQRFMRRLTQHSRSFQVFGDCRVIPVGEIGDEIEQREPQDVPVCFLASVEAAVRFGERLPLLPRVMRASLCQRLIGRRLGGECIERAASIFPEFLWA